MAKTKIVVVGAGYSGVFATKTLSKKLKKNPDVEITLIDRHSYQTMMTELHEVAGGRVEPTAIQYDLQRLFCKRKNVKLVTDNVTTIDKENKVVVTENGEYPFDYVMLGMGGEPNDFGTPGVKEHGYTLWSMEDSIKLREHIQKTVKKAAIEPDAELRKAMLTFVVCGSGFTGIEMMGELLDWKDRLAKDNKITADEIQLLVVEAAPTILNMLDRNDAGKAERFMVKKGIQILKDSPIVEVSEDSIRLKNGDIIPTHTLIWTAGVQANSDAKEFGMESARANRLVANEYMQAKGFEDKGVYVVGDLVYYEEFENTPTPQIVQAAEGTGHCAATNIVAEINGTEKHKYKGNYQGFMVSIGSKYGVACLFDKIHLSGFLAILMKHMINLKYFLDIRSGYYAFQYMMHEFFHIKDERNVARGHSSRNSNVLWSVPLRIFYGLVWLVEAMKKVVGEGDYLKPSTWFGEGSWFTDTVAFPFPWLQDAATTGASAAGDTAAAGATDTATQAAFGLSYAYGEEPMLVFDHMPKWFSSVMEFMMPNKEVALFMQKFMTIFEVLIALALIAGLFTWLASATTIALVAAFCLSGMFYWVNIWFIPVAFALMNGSGRALGLDKWVVPWLQRKLGKWWYGDVKSIYGRSI
ncbi:NAD(P)/FAD-dependent oxidoreductase [Vagococcus intermedius]|uniref:NADH:ubiquinone reductase (non-electrogenic) n=1 Tax=Vagococcus intermedius TaxID=2991418 RepID=A0AAF0I7G6_9ENTE|nr:NAD(P)/FAD-dependent oxidoreductase [Vagococcus intermedius]WEG73350.1 NAD(P)/FAD-dependent oxidoreductase [Vagococcus intermedius]WEG75430.1 NAD(P)/FAD-dependent oxidoreductase [Vagococcus intermedius]